MTDTNELPRVVLRDREDEDVRALRWLQTLVLAHPVAAQALFSALVAEGRAFAATAAGRAWKERLCRSSLLHRARLVFETGTMWTLDDAPPGPLPSGYLDAVFMSASGGRMEAVMNRLFRESSTDGEADSA